MAQSTGFNLYSPTAGACDGVDEPHVDARGAVDEDVLEVHVLDVAVTS
jgi:hypothetical protein